MRRGIFSKSSNPALATNIFESVQAAPGEGVMTMQGVANKTFLLLAIVFFCATIVWQNPGKFMPLLLVSSIAAFVVGLITVFNPRMAKVTSIIYAVCEGFLLGTISSFFDKMYPGIVVQAVGCTFGVMTALLILYKSRLVPVTQNFIFIVSAATLGLAIFYLISFIGSFFGWVPTLITSSSPMGIGFSVVVVIIASLNLYIDFFFIEESSKYGAPAYMEWYGAFSLLVTLIWLYIEILRLLAKLRDNR